MLPRSLLYVTFFLLGLVLRPLITSVYPFGSWLSCHYRLNAIEFGLLTTIPILCMGVFAFVAQVWQRYCTREWLILLGILMISAGHLLRAYGASKAQLMLATGIGSMGIGITGSLVGGLVKSYHPQHVVQSMGIYSLGIGAGAVLGSRLWLSDWSASQQYLAGGAMLCAWVFASRCGRRTILQSCLPVKSRLVYRQERAVLTCLVMIFGLQALLNYTLLAWISCYYQSLPEFHAITSQQVAFCLLLVQLTAAYLVPLLAANSAQKIALLYGLIAILLMALLLLTLQPVNLFVLIILGLGVSTGAIFPISMSLPLLLAHDVTQASQWFTKMLGRGYLLSAIGPLLFGLILNWLTTYLLALMLLLSLALLLWIAVYVLHSKIKDNHDVAY